jgi:predicted AlkP superfamily phosphohydrolase/phosphomutase
MPSHPRILAIALDAASPALLTEWAEDGTLPNIGRLFREGLSGPSRTLDGFYHGATWPSFYTGRSPGKHGVYWLHQLKTGDYDQHRLSAEQLMRYPSLWDVLSGAGRRVAVLDVPFDPPRPTFNGLHTVQWYTHDPHFEFCTTPEHLAAEIRKTEGTHPAPEFCDKDRHTAQDYRLLIDQLKQGTGLRSNLTKRLLKGTPWDFAVAVFAETHCAGHQLWLLHDPAHPGHDPAVVRQTGNGLREVYVEIDRAVGEILDAVAGTETTVVLLDLHGMSFAAGAWLLLPVVLERLGHMTPLPPKRPPGLAKRTIAPLWRALPEALRDALLPLKRAALGPLPPLIREGTSPPQFVPAGTRAYPIMLGQSVSGIRFNIAGRDPQGLLRPEEVAGFGDALRAELLSLRDPNTGAPVTADVRWTADIYQGEAIPDLPDLIVDWDLTRPIGSAGVGSGAGSVMRAASPRIGTVEFENRNCRSGEHRNEGLFIAKGPGIAQGTLDRTVSTMDYAPTFARMLGVEMESDGKIISEMLE